MDNNRMIRSELAYWDDDKTTVELYEDFIHFAPVGDKAIDIKYANIVSCKRYIKELSVTSKGSSQQGFYDIHYIPLKFENKEVAQYFFSFIADRVQQFAELEQTDRESHHKKDDGPIYTIPSRMGFAEGVLYIFDDHFSFRVSGQGENARLQYSDIHEVIKSFGTIRFVFGRNQNITFQIPKALYAEVYKYLDTRIKNMHIRKIDTEPEFDISSRSGVGSIVNDMVIADSNVARGMVDDNNMKMGDKGRLKNSQET